MSPIIAVGDTVYIPDGKNKDGIPVVVEGCFRRMQGSWCVITNSGRELIVHPRMVFKTNEAACFYTDTASEFEKEKEPCHRTRRRG